MQEDLPQTIKINIEDEMRDSYMDYAMRVIVGRALRAGWSKASPSAGPLCDE